MSEDFVELDKFPKNKYEKEEIKKYGAPKRIIDEIFEYVRTKYSIENREELQNMLREKVVSLKNLYFYVESVQSYIRQAEILPEDANETYRIAYSISLAAEMINNNCSFRKPKHEKYVPTPEEREERRARKEATLLKNEKINRKECPAKRKTNRNGNYGYVHAGMNK